MDEDKRRLMLYQERYLADGDLHSDGPGRARRFRWKNMGRSLLESDRGRRASRVASAPPPSAVVELKMPTLLSDEGFNADGMGGEDEEEEEDEHLDQSEVQRRKDRLEREQWLREQVSCACRRPSKLLSCP